MIRWVIFILIFGIIDFYAFQAVKTIFRSKSINIVYLLISLLVIGNLIYQLTSSGRGGLNTRMNLAIGLFLTLYIPKIVVMMIMFGEDILRVPQAVFQYFTEGKNSEGTYMPSRRVFVSKLALGIAAIPFASFLYGMYKGRYNFKVLKYTLHFEDFISPHEAVKNADLVTTDVWTSMGFEAETEQRKADFADFCVDAEMMAMAKKDAVFMHCLPAHRGEEVAAEVIDGPQSVVWDEAENRLHAQKAILSMLTN